MRVDSQISNLSMTRFQQSADLRMDGGSRGRGRSAVRSFEVLEQEDALEVTSGRITRASDESATFAQMVRTTSLPSIELQEAVVGLIQTTPAAESAAGRQQGTKESCATLGDGLIHTPFGTFDAASINARIVTDVIASSPWEVYFMTHAPAEWKSSASAREAFSELYGDKALAVLDCHGTVPKNMDPTWVTEPGYTLPSERA